MEARAIEIPLKAKLKLVKTFLKKSRVNWNLPNATKAFFKKTWEAVSKKHWTVTKLINFNIFLIKLNYGFCYDNDCEIKPFLKDLLHGIYDKNDLKNGCF